MSSEENILRLLDKLEELRQQGVLSEKEYEEKKVLLAKRLTEVETKKKQLGETSPSIHPKVSKTIRSIMLITLIVLVIAIAVLMGVCFHLNHEYNQLSREYEGLSKSYATLQSEHEDLKASYNTLQGSYDKLEQQFSQLQERHDALTEENKQIRQELASLRSERESLANLYNDLQTKFQTLSSNYESLQDNYAKLQRDYNELQSNYNHLQEDYTRLEERYRELEQSAGTWKDKYNQLMQSYTALETKYENLQASYEELQKKVEELETILRQYEQVPHNYYNVDNFASSGTAGELKQILRKAHEMLSKDWMAGVFDCSESTAFIEWVLEDAGYNAYIAVGRAPWDPEAGYHAWVIAYTRDGYIAAIECTITTSSKSIIELELLDYGIIYADNPYAKGYYEGYDYLFKNIYQAIRYFGKFEWNWWEGYWGFI